MSFDTTEDQLREQFGSFGEVTSVSIITDKYDGRPKGFGFIEMAQKSEAIEAITALNGKEVNGRTLNVNEAKPRTDNNNRRGGGNNFRRNY